MRLLALFVTEPRKYRWILQVSRFPSHSPPYEFPLVAMGEQECDDAAEGGCRRPRLREGDVEFVVVEDGGGTHGAGKWSVSTGEDGDCNGGGEDARAAIGSGTGVCGETSSSTARCDAAAVAAFNDDHSYLESSRSS